MKRGVKGSYDWSLTIGSASSRLTRHNSDGDAYYYQGVVATRLGYVYVYSQGGARCRASSSYRAIIGGVEYAFSEPVSRTERGLAIMAAKFIERLHEEVSS